MLWRTSPLPFCSCSVCIVSVCVVGRTLEDLVECFSSFRSLSARSRERLSLIKHPCGVGLLTPTSSTLEVGGGGREELVR